MNPYKKEEVDPLAPKTVFTIRHSEIPKGITQCTKHSWRKLNENELECTQCPTIVIVNPEVLEAML